MTTRRYERALLLTAMVAAGCVASSAATVHAQERAGDREIDSGATLPFDVAGTDILLPGGSEGTGDIEGPAADGGEEEDLATEEHPRVAGDAEVEVRLSPCLAEVTVVLPPATPGGLPIPATYIFAVPPRASDFELVLRLGGRTLRTGLGDIPAGTPAVIPHEAWDPVLQHTIPGAFADDSVDVRIGYDIPQAPGVAGGRLVALPDAVIRGPRSHDTVRQHILRHRRRVVRYCRTRRHEVISVTFVITARGAVTASTVSRSTTGDPIVDYRLAQAVQRIPFPPLAREGVTVVTYPIAVRPARTYY